MRERTTGRGRIAAAALAVALAAPAYAQMPPAERATQIAEEATALFDGRRFEEASELFLRAWQLHRDPRYLFNAARAREVAGDLAAAARLYARYTALDPAPGDRAEVAERLEDLARGLARSHAAVRIRTEPPGAVVSLDGGVAEPAPVDGWLVAGAHRIEATLDGHEAATRTLTVAAGETRDVTITLERATEVGALAVATEVPGADVYVDNRYVGVTPLRLDGVATGPHTVRLAMDGFREWRGSVQVEARGEREVRIDLLPDLIAATPPPGLDLSLPGWVTLGTGVALAAVGAGLHVAAFGAADEAAALAPESTTYTEDFDALEERGRALEAAAWVNYGLAVAAIGTGVTLLVLSDPEPDTVVAPVPLPDGGGLGVSGRF